MKGDYRQLFNSSQFIKGKEDAADNYARGHYTTGKEYLPLALDRIREQAESCTNLQGFVIYNSFGGGTGSGFTALLAEHLSEDYNKKPKIQFGVYPSPYMSNSVVEPYNSVFTHSATLRNIDCSFLVDNEALFKICDSYLSVHDASYLNINRLVSQIASSITASMRLGGSMNADMNDFQANSIPQPDIHFPVVSFAPMTSVEGAYRHQATVTEMTGACFERDSQTLTFDSSTSGVCLTCSLMFRGDVTPRDVNAAIDGVRSKRNVLFGNRMNADGIKIGLVNSQPSFVLGGDLGQMRHNLCTLNTTTAIVDIWAGVANKFDMLYAKRAFVHWYVGEGMEQGEFTEAMETLAVLRKDYADIGGANPVSEEVTQAKEKSGEEEEEEI